MKILYLLHSFLTCGGVKIAFIHCDELSLRGHEVYLCYQLSNYKSNWYPFKSKNIHIISYHEALNNKIFEDMDIIMATFWSTAYDINKIQTKATKYYYVQQRESNFYLNSNEKQIVEGTYKLPINIITIANWLQNFLKKEYDKDSYLVRWGLDFENIFFPEPKLNKNKFTVLVEGSPNNKWKNNGIVYEALKGLDVDIWSLSVEPETRSNKHFQNPPQEMIRQIYSSVDVVVKPSISEGLSAIPAEAMSCGCNVIASDIAGINEYVVHEYNGLLVPANNKEAIKNSVIKLMKNKDLCNTLKINGYKTVREKFQWSDKIDLLEDILSNANKLKPKW